MAYFLSIVLIMASWLVPPDKDARNFRLRTLEGERVSLNQFQGKVLLLHFWATWSSPSTAELERLQDLHKKYRSRGLRVLAIAVDDSRDRVRQFISRHPFQLLVAHDRKARVAASYQVETIPSTFLIDRDGRIRAVYRGGRSETYFADLVYRIEKLLAEKATTKSKKVTSSFADLVLGVWP